MRYNTSSPHSSTYFSVGSILNSVPDYLSLPCSTFMSTLNQIHHMIIFIHLILHHFLFKFIHLFILHLKKQNWNWCTYGKTAVHFTHWQWVMAPRHAIRNSYTNEQSHLERGVNFPTEENMGHSSEKKSMHCQPWNTVSYNTAIRLKQTPLSVFTL